MVHWSVGTLCVCVCCGRAEARAGAFWNTFAKAVFSLVEISVEVVPKHEHCICAERAPPYCVFFSSNSICFRHFVRVDISIEILLAETKSEKITSLRAILEYGLMRAPCCECLCRQKRN